MSAKFTDVVSGDDSIGVAEAAPLRCGGCDGPHRFDTSVPSVLWNRVVRAQGLSDYLCTACIVRAFAKAGVSFTATLYGDGFDGLPIAVEINGATATTAHEVSEQNNTLRAALWDVHDRARAVLDGAFASAASPERAQRVKPHGRARGQGVRG